MVSSVSPRYAWEIQTPEYSHGLHYVLERNLHKLCGILNGIDYNYYNPAKDAPLAKN
jgi:starch synthase